MVRDRDGELGAVRGIFPCRLDRIRIDRTHIVGSIDPVNPVYTYKVEQIQAVDGNRRRRFPSTAICSSVMVPKFGTLNVPNFGS